MVAEMKEKLDEYTREELPKREKRRVEMEAKWEK
jgi:hypothetical protein